MSTTLEETLKTAANAASAMAPVLPGPLGTVASVAGIALQAGSGFARDGQDPVKEIRRILSAAPEVKKVHAQWDAMIDRKFPQSQR